MTARDCTCGGRRTVSHNVGCPQAPHAAELDRALGDAPRAAVKGMYDGGSIMGEVALSEDYYHGGQPTGIDLVDDRKTYTGDHMEVRSPAHALDPDRRFLADVAREVASARTAFPGNGSLITGLALGEESGEAQRALLHIHEGKGAEDGVWLECVQTAAMALRLATESRDRTEWKGNLRAQLRSDMHAVDPIKFPRRTD